MKLRVVSRINLQHATVDGLEIPRANRDKQATKDISTCRIYSNHVVDVAIKTIADSGFIQRRLRNG
jgi:hypothetical protein